MQENECTVKLKLRTSFR